MIELRDRFGSLVVGVEPAKANESGDCEAGVVPKAPLAKANALATPP